MDIVLSTMEILNSLYFHNFNISTSGNGDNKRRTG